MRRPRVLICYHFFHPDSVVSARLFTDLALGLDRRGWDVRVLTSNRDCHDATLEYPGAQRYGGVRVRRCWRPAAIQDTGKGRILNAAFMIARWGLELLRGVSGRPDVLVLGTDPILSVLLAPAARQMMPGVKIAHWCFDLYPHAAIADGLLRENSRLVRLLNVALRHSYAACDLIADLGPCMRALLEQAQGGRAAARRVKTCTLTPWALSEPDAVEAPDATARRALFGDARLTLLYPGSFGRAHSADLFLKLARRLRDASIAFCFGIRGRRADELQAQVTAEDGNVSFAGFVTPEQGLAARLAAADIHMASLTPQWTGMVVPSKFFGSLASGRPVIYEGDERSAVARWIREHDVGWVLTPDTLDEVARKLRALADESGALNALQERCHRVYHAHFARARVLDAWDRNLRDLLRALA